MPIVNNCSGYLKVCSDCNLIMEKYIFANYNSDKLDTLVFNTSGLSVSFTEIKNFIDSINNEMSAQLILDDVNGGDTIEYYGKILTFSIGHYSCGMKFKLQINTPDHKKQVINVFEKIYEHFSNEHKKSDGYKRILERLRNKYKNTDEYKKLQEQYCNEYENTEEYKLNLETYIKNKK